MKVSAPGELTRESIPDAPKGEWIDTMLSNRNEFIRNAVRAFRNALTRADNTPYPTKSIDMKHDTEIEIGNPFGKGSGLMVKGVSALQCDGLELDDMGRPTGKVYALDKPNISWRQKEGADDGTIIVKATYDLRHTEPCLFATSSSPQTLPYNVDTTIENWDTITFSRGDIITTDGELFTVSEAGTYIVTALLAFETGVSYDLVTLDFDPGGYIELPVPFSNGPAIRMESQLQLAAGGSFAVQSLQSNGAAASRNLIDQSIQISRLYNDTVPVGRVNLFFYGE